MYKIVGADGKQYGPVTVDQLRDWLAQGRINALTKVQASGSNEWRPVAEVPDLSSLFGPSLSRQPGQGAPPVLSKPALQTPRKGLAVLSFVLGLASFVLCLSVLAGIPAIICGHIARRRAIRLPARFSGGGFAKAGLMLGYLSIAVALLIAAMVIPGLPKTKRSVPLTDCQNNLRQIGLAFKVWALEHGDKYPFNVSTNAGGTLELRAIGNDGFDNNAVAHFRMIANELSTPGFLVCPNDPQKHPASDFDSLRQEALSYRLLTGTNVNPENPQAVLAVCPIHGNELYCNATVRKARASE